MNPKQIALRWFEQLWNQRNPAVIQEIMDPSVVGVTEGGEIRGPEQFRTLVYEPLVGAFPDMKVKVDNILAEGDEVAIRWTVTANHTGQLMHLSASGKKVRFSGMTWLKFRNGKVISGSDSYNFHGLLEYLAGGAVCASVASH